MPSRISGWRSKPQDSQPRDEKSINSMRRNLQSAPAAPAIARHSDAPAGKPRQQESSSATISCSLVSWGAPLGSHGLRLVDGTPPAGR